MEQAEVKAEDEMNSFLKLNLDLNLNLIYIFFGLVSLWPNYYNNIIAFFRARRRV